MKKWKSVKELKKDFEGKRHHFTCKILMELIFKKGMAELFNRVWEVVYKKVACNIGKDNACRAVGNANNKTNYL